MSTLNSADLRVADLSLEVQIAAAPSTVWNALTDDIAAWWPSLFYCGSGSGDGSRSFILEARPGGRMWEDWGAGEGLLWATVVNVVRERTLEMTGTIGPAWGGPATWYGGFALEADGDGTKVRFSESGFGRIADPTLAEKEKGWRFLLESMRAHVEGNQPPQWAD